MSEAKKPGERAEAGEARTIQQIDDSRVQALYANFFRVTNTAEELVVDFGLNAATAESQNVPVVLSQRLVLNHYTAKRLFQALGLTLERHEKAFGVIETNVQKRVVRPQQPST